MLYLLRFAKSLEALCFEVKSARAAPFLIFGWYRPPNVCMDIFHQLEESMKVLDRENKDVLQNYLDGDSLSNNLPIVYWKTCCTHWKFGAKASFTRI